eukprot:m.273428 g.273428  ORF g.273428 m.273428 type:complete len:102 (+) comp19755_c0_seq28:258-563(+)
MAGRTLLHVTYCAKLDSDARILALAEFGKSCLPCGDAAAAEDCWCSILWRPLCEQQCKLHVSTQVPHCPTSVNLLSTCLRFHRRLVKVHGLASYTSAQQDV